MKTVTQFSLILLVRWTAVLGGIASLHLGSLSLVQAARCVTLACGIHPIAHRRIPPLQRPVTISVVGVGDDFENAINRSVGTNQLLVHQYLTPTGNTYWVQIQNTPTPWSGTSVTINDIMLHGLVERLRQFVENSDLSFYKIGSRIGTSVRTLKHMACCKG